jgi:hypothetical protein
MLWRGTRWSIFGRTRGDLRRWLNRAEAVALGIEHGGSPWPCHTSSPDLRFAHARATQPQVFFIVRDQDSAGNSPRGTTGGGGHWETARDGGRHVSVFGSVDGEFQGLGAVGKWPKRCGASSSSPTRGWRGPKCCRAAARRVGWMLGFDLNLCEIRAWGDSIYWAFWSPACTERIRSRPYLGV